ncbi:MAG: hypothetical protein IT214_08040 [Chitinophagaceae bacterium]|nr:hypothetical protein [Chitinophagaceae bacterium]
MKKLFIAIMTLGLFSLTAAAQKTQQDNKPQIRAEQNFRNGISSQKQPRQLKKNRKSFKTGKKKFHKRHTARHHKRSSMMKKHSGKSRRVI